MRRLFGWHGRPSRKPFTLIWFGSYGAAALVMLGWFALLLAVAPSGPAAAEPGRLLSPVTLVVGLAGLSVVPLIYFQVVAAARRFHDLGQPGWRAIGVLALTILGSGGLAEVLGSLSFVELQAAADQIRPTALAVSLLVLTVLVLWPGADGTNRFGPDPRDRQVWLEIDGLGPVAAAADAPARHAAAPRKPVHMPRPVGPARPTFGQRTGMAQTQGRR
jgi:uncharacterized membrane protein YhaH (DUF805 family)